MLKYHFCPTSKSDIFMMVNVYKQCPHTIPPTSLKEQLWWINNIGNWFKYQTVCALTNMTSTIASIVVNIHTWPISSVTLCGSQYQKLFAALRALHHSQVLRLSPSPTMWFNTVSHKSLARKPEWPSFSIFSVDLFLYNAVYSQFSTCWKVSTHNAYVNECCDGHWRLSCFQQSSTDLAELRVMSALYTVCSLFSGIENAVSNLSLTICLNCVLLYGDLEGVLPWFDKHGTTVYFK